MLQLFNAILKDLVSVPFTIDTRELKFIPHPLFDAKEAAKMASSSLRVLTRDVSELSRDEPGELTRRAGNFWLVDITSVNHSSYIVYCIVTTYCLAGWIDCYFCLPRGSKNLHVNPTCTLCKRFENLTRTCVHRGLLTHDWFCSRVSRWISYYSCSFV